MKKSRTKTTNSISGPDFFITQLCSDSNINKTIITNGKDAFEALGSNKIDVYIYGEWQLERILNKSDYRNKIVRSGYYISEYHPGYLVMSKKSKYMDRLGDFSNVINDLLLEGKIQEIINNYFPVFYE